MKLKFGTSSLVLTRSENSVKLEIAMEKIQGLIKSLLVIVAFSLTAILAIAGYLWLSLGIFLSLIILLAVDLFINGLSYPMDFELDPELSIDILDDVLVEGR